MELLPILIGIVLSLVIIILFTIGRNQKLTEKMVAGITTTVYKNKEGSSEAAERLYLAIKSFLIVFILFAVLVTIAYITG